MIPLPVDEILPQLVASLRRTPNLVLEAAPGAGKTTRVPPALLALFPGEIVVLEPRRIAARMAARRVAQELGEEVGETVGFQVRFEDRTGPRTRLRFVTEGILARRLLSDPQLKGVDAVILDEFHERHIDSDLALALLKRLQQQRPTLRLIVMSATLDAAPIAHFLGDAPILRSAGRLFPLTIRHRPYTPEPLQVQLRRAVELLQSEQHAGSILAFLPGAAEIRRCARACEDLARRTGLLILPLHGDLAPAEQDRAVAPSREPRLILATNVAESSITVEGVTAVIDSGLARIATHSPWTGLPTLEIARVSRASCIQRGGRAGRTAAGQVIRLFPEEDFNLRPEHDLPEIERADLAQLLLTLRAMRIEHLAELDWLTRPPAAAIDTAEALLDLLGASGARGAALAQRLARFPLPPRLARMLVEAIDRGVGEDGCRAAALLSLGNNTSIVDLLAALDLPPDEGLRQHTAQLLRLARPPRQAGQNDEALLLSLLAGFPDRVAKRRAGVEVQLANGLSAELAGSAPGYQFLLALDAEDRREKPLPLIRLSARCEPEWLLDVLPGQVRELATTVWSRQGERVERQSALLYGKLVLAESRGPAPAAEAAGMLAAKALERGLEAFVDREALDNFLHRVAFAGVAAPSAEDVLRELCEGLSSFNELRAAASQFLPLLESRANARQLSELAPATLGLPAGRSVKVHYEADRPPWIASRLQDFFGMLETPRLGPAKTPLVIHLLAPNQRPVQTTTDLAGFWERLYPTVRRELMRRYPRHQWPEKPAAGAS